jgi:hypothetical protein
MGNQRQNRLVPISLGAVCVALLVMASRGAAAQGVVTGGDLFGAGGTGGYGIGGAASLAAGKTNTTTLGLSAGVGETDNVLLTSGTKQSQTLATAGLDFSLSRHGPRLNTAAAGDFEDVYYLQSAFGNQLLGRFDGDATVGIVPDRINWTVDENFGQSIINPVAPTVPTNLGNINVFSTGPDFILHPGGEANFVQLGARYGRSDFQRAAFDGYQELGLFAIGRALSSLSTLSLHANVEKLRFSDTALNPDYTFRRAYASYVVQGARTGITIEAGAAQVDDVTRRWTTRPIGQITLQRLLSPHMSLTLQGGRQVTDINDSFAGLQSGAAGAIVVAPAYGSTGSYVRTFGTASWSFAFNRTSLGASASWERNSYDVSQLLDTRSGDYEVSLGRQLAPHLAVRVTGALTKSDYYNTGFESEYRTVNVAFQLQAAPKVRVSLSYQHTSQGTSGVATVLTRSGYFNLFTVSSLYVTDAYSANAAFLTVTYLPLE